MMFTTRKGVWEAQSALAWEQLCSERSIGLARITQVNKLFTLVAPEDINDFAKSLFDTTFGTHKMRRWGFQLDD